MRHAVYEGVHHRVGHERPLLSYTNKSFDNENIMIIHFCSYVQYIHFKTAFEENHMQAQT